MKVLLAVDPGIDRCGVAVLHDERLHAVAYVGRSAGADEDPVQRVVQAAEHVRQWVLALNRAPNLAVIEWPRIYTAGKSKGSGNDILPLAAVAGAIAVNLLHIDCRTTSTPPYAWKGTVPKDVMTQRVIAKLYPDERSVLDSSMEKVSLGRRHNAVDAVGIALHAVGRLSRVR